MEQDEKPKIAELKRPRAGCFWLCVLITIIFLIFLVPRYGWGIMALTSPVIIFGILDLISYFEEDAKTRPLESADAYYSRGIKKLNLHYYKEAINDFTYAIGLDPRHITSFLHRGLAKTSLKDYKGALSDYNHAIRLDPDNKVSYFYRGRLRKDYLNDYKGAITDYTKSIEGAAYDEITYENRGNSKYKLKDYNGAIADYSKAIETSIEPESLFFYRGNAKYRLGDFGGAIADFSQSIEHDPYYADAYFNRGVTKERMNDHNEAIIDFNKAIEIAPKNKEVYSDQSEIKDDLTDIAGEMVDLTWVKDIEHYFEDTVDNKKAAEEVRLGHEKAVSDHIKVIEIIPEQVITFFHKRSLKWIALIIVAILLITVGLFLREKEKKGKIETEDREKSIQKENTGIVADSVPVADNVPVVDSLLNTSSVNKTVNVNKDSEDAVDYYNLGVATYFYVLDSPVYLIKKDNKRLINYFTKSIELYPGYVKAYCFRGIIKSEKKDSAGAMADFNKATHLDPKNPDVYWYKGNAQNILNDFKGAIVSYTNSIELDPEYMDAYRNRGFAYTNLHNYDKAISDFSKVINLYSDYQTALRNKGLEKIRPPYKKVVNLSSGMTRYVPDRSFQPDMNGYLNDLATANHIGLILSFIYCYRGNTKYLSQDYQGATDDCAKAIEHNHECVFAYLIRGNIKSKLQNYSEAIADYTEVINLDTSFEKIETYYERKKRGYIVDYNYVQPIELENPYAEAFYKRGLAKIMSGGKDSGCLDLNKAKEFGFAEASAAIKKYCR